MTWGKCHELLQFFITTVHLLTFSVCFANFISIDFCFFLAYDGKRLRNGASEGMAR